MQDSSARKTITSFLLYAKSGGSAQPAMDTISVLALYVVAAAFLVSSIANVPITLRTGSWTTAAFLAAYVALSAAGIAAFWKTRRVPAGKAFLCACFVLLLAEQVVDVGGVYGFGVLYLMLGFPALYLLMGFAPSCAFILVYDVLVSYRILTGFFLPHSILNYDGVRERMVVFLGVATALELLICLCLEFLKRHFIRLAYFDKVSGLPNRYKIGTMLRNEISFYRDKPSRMSVIAVKMLNLGSSNASMGAEQADRLLEEVGARLQAHAGARDCVGRWSSSIFLDITRVTDSGGLEAYSRELIERLSRPYLVEGRSASAFFTLAITRYPEDASSADELVANAISLLAQGEKRPGEIRFFDEKAMALQRKRYALIDDLDAADYDRDFRLAYQPIMSLPKARCVGAEVLLRWKGRDGEDVPPNLFIPLAEQSGSIRKITHWVIRRAVADLRGAALDEAAGLSFAINLSVLDLRDRDFPDFVQRTLEEFGCPSLRLEFEITEGVMLDDDPRTRQNIERLLSDGFRLSIDDFGTGYSSLSYLHRVKADSLKIDQSFIRCLPPSNGQDESPVIEAIISMSKSLKISTVAEGVENGEQLEYLISRGCDLAQGYYFSPGVAFPEYLGFFKENRA